MWLGSPCEGMPTTNRRQEHENQRGSVQNVDRFHHSLALNPPQREGISMHVDTALKEPTLN